MRKMFGSAAWGRAAHAAVLAAGLLALTGCVADYAYVQPDAAGSGGYYTRDLAYSGQGYYDDYGTGPYYPGTSGYGYYGPDSNTFGWDDGVYGYWPPVTFNFGISNVWDFPGYWGPWYSTVVPVRGCWNGCRRDWRRHDRHRHGGGYDPVATSPPDPRLKPDRPRGPPGSRGAERFARMPVRPAERFADRPPLPSTRFVPHDSVHGPDTGITGERLDGPTWRMSMPRVPAEPDFAGRRAMPMPARSDFRAVPQPVASPAPRSVPAAQPPPRADTSRSRIP